MVIARVLTMRSLVNLEQINIAQSCGFTTVAAITIKVTFC